MRRNKTRKVFNYETKSDIKLFDIIFHPEWQKKQHFPSSQFVLSCDDALSIPEG